MQHELDRSNFREDQALAFEPHAIPILRVGHAVIATKTLKTRVADILGSFSHTTKVGSERQINPLRDVLQDHRMYQFQRRAIRFPDWEQALGFVPIRGALLIFIGTLAIGERFVIDPTAKFQRLNQLGSLAFGGLKAILESSQMRSNAVLSNILLVFNLLLQDSNWRTTNSRNEIRMHPQARRSLFQMWKLLAKQTRTTTLHPLHKFMHSELRVYFAKDMNMVGHHFQFHHLTSQFLYGLIKTSFNRLSTPFTNTLRQYFGRKTT
jgi:hypothetical protein